MTLMPTPRVQHPWLRRLVVSILVIVLFLAAAGFLYENICEARDRRFNAMPGRLIDVDTRTMHIDCTGEGSPAVILESGLGDSYTSWRKVQPKIAAFTRVCSYDKAGLGYSSPSPDSRTSDVIAKELHILLQAAGVPPPYILVGHSMGGYDVRLYANLFHNEVVGMVLVDSSHPEQDHRFPGEVQDLQGSWQREAEFLEYTMPFGLPRLLGLCDENVMERAADCNFHTARETLAEMRAFSTSASLTAAAGKLGDMPLVVLSHDPDKLMGDLSPEAARSTNEAWEKMQEELASLSTRGTQKIVKGSGHYVQLDHPEAVVDSIHDVFNQVRAAEGPSLKP